MSPLFRSLVVRSHGGSAPQGKPNGPSSSQKPCSFSGSSASDSSSRGRTSRSRRRREEATELRAGRRRDKSPPSLNGGASKSSIHERRRNTNRNEAAAGVVRALTEMPGSTGGKEGKGSNEKNRRSVNVNGDAAQDVRAGKERVEQHQHQQEVGGKDGDAMVYKNKDRIEVSEAFTLGWPRTLHECYELGKEIGRGSFGIVRVARERWPVQFTSQSPTTHRMLQQKFAVKSIPKRPKRRTRRKRAIQGDEALNAERIVRRQKEKLLGEVAFMVALSDCPFSAQLVGAYEDETHAHLVVELCEGGDLKHLLKRKPTLTEKEACEVMFTVLNFIDHCHRKGFVFSDVKPANFMLKFKMNEHNYAASEEDDDGAGCAPIVVKGIDFGCSQRIGDPSRRDMLIKRTGTPAYWAPEVFMRYYDGMADVWSCGMMMYELLLGKLPFWDDIEACTPKEVQRGVMYGDLDFSLAPVSNYDSLAKGEDVPLISENAQHLIRRMLEKNPNSRITVKEALEHPWIQENHY